MHRHILVSSGCHNKIPQFWRLEVQGQGTVRVSGKTSLPGLHMAPFFLYLTYIYSAQRERSSDSSSSLFYRLCKHWNKFLIISLICFIDYAITVVPFPPPFSLCPAHSLPPTFPPFSSCPWVIHISSLASPFPILFLPSPCLFSTYHLCYLFSVPFPPSPPPTPLLITLHVISISVILILF